MEVHELNNSRLEKTRSFFSSRATLVDYSASLNGEKKGLSFEKAIADPQNTLTKHFSKAEWNALRQLRVSLATMHNHLRLSGYIFRYFVE